MRKLIVARHGHYRRGGEEHLSEIGIKQVSSLAERLKLLVGGDEKTLILASPALRARESAEILARVLMAKVELHEILQSDESHDMQIYRVIRFVESRVEDADVIVLVTHSEYAQVLPSCSSSVLGFEINYQKELDYAEAWFIDKDNKSYSILEQLE